MRSPLSNHRKDKGQGFLKGGNLFLAKQLQHTTVIVHPLDYCQSLWDTTLERKPQSEVITNDEVDLMCPAKDNDKPWHQPKKQMPHPACISTIVGACSNNLNAICLFTPFDIFNN